MFQVMLTTRNIFIANLAVSDILLCAFTMPLTLVDLITKYWTLGPDQVFFTVPSAVYK
jgi:neuropeptide Y receptor